MSPYFSSITIKSVTETSKALASNPIVFNVGFCTPFLILVIVASPKPVSFANSIFDIHFSAIAIFKISFFVYPPFLFICFNQKMFNILNIFILLIILLFHILSIIFCFFLTFRTISCTIFMR